MFDDVIRKLRQLERGVQVPINLELDDNGYLDRVCPSDECGTHFKVLFDDWRDIVRDEEVFCPLCRHDGESDEWNTPEHSIGSKTETVSFRCQCRTSKGGFLFLCPQWQRTL